MINAAIIGGWSDVFTKTSDHMERHQLLIVLIISVIVSDTAIAVHDERTSLEVVADLCEGVNQSNTVFIRKRRTSPEEVGTKDRSALDNLEILKMSKENLLNGNKRASLLVVEIIHFTIQSNHSMQTKETYLLVFDMNVNDSC